MSTAVFTIAMNAVQAVTIAIGFIGSVLSVMIFSKKTFRNNSICTYCISMTIVECLSLFKFASNIGVLAYGVNLADQSDEFCKVSNFITTLLSSIRPCIMVAFSIDKLLTMRTRSITIIKKKWFQWSLVIAIVLFNTGLYIELPIYIKRRVLFPGRYLCDGSTTGFYTIFMIVVLLETCLIPFVIMIITSVLTIRLLLKSRNSVERNGKLTQERKSRDFKYAVSSVTLNIMFIVLKLPLVIFNILSSFYSYNDVYFYNGSLFLFYLNMSLSFFVHLVTNSLFRQEFFTLLSFLKGIKDTLSTSHSKQRLNQVSII